MVITSLFFFVGAGTSRYFWATHLSIFLGPRQLVRKKISVQKISGWSLRGMIVFRIQLGFFYLRNFNVQQALIIPARISIISDKSQKI
jgi:hypothetical protein